MHMISFGGQLQNVKQFECTQVVSCQIDDCHPVGWFRKTWLVIHSSGRGSMQVGILRREGEEGGGWLRNRIRGGSGGDYEDDQGEDHDYGDHDICRP